MHGISQSVHVHSKTNRITAGRYVCVCISTKSKCIFEIYVAQVSTKKQYVQSNEHAAMTENIPH